MNKHSDEIKQIAREACLKLTTTTFKSLSGVGSFDTIFRSTTLPPRSKNVEAFKACIKGVQDFASNQLPLMTAVVDLTMKEHPVCLVVFATALSRREKEGYIYDDSMLEDQTMWDFCVREAKEDLKQLLRGSKEGTFRTVDCLERAVQGFVDCRKAQWPQMTTSSCVNTMLDFVEHLEDDIPERDLRLIEDGVIASLIDEREKIFDKIKALEEEIENLKKKL